MRWLFSLSSWTAGMTSCFLFWALIKASMERSTWSVYLFTTQSKCTIFGFFNARNGIPRISLSCVHGEVGLFAFDAGFWTGGSVRSSTVLGLYGVSRWGIWGNSFFVPLRQLQMLDFVWYVHESVLLANCVLKFLTMKVDSINFLNLFPGW